jgi:3-deoxy-D-manno-octulosonic-acid transferase
MFLVYSVLYGIALAFLLPYEYLKRPGPLRKRWLRERFGATGPSQRVTDPSQRVTDPSQRVTDPSQRVTDPSQRATGHSQNVSGPYQSIWVHAVSVGEVMAASAFLKALKERHPGLRIIVSTVTDTGQKVARERLSDLAEVIYLPFDMAALFRRAVERIRPRLFLVMETEIWPNALRVLRQKGVPAIVLNGRISEASFRGYKRVRFFIRRVLDDIALFCMQDEVYAGRIIELGADNNNVMITGNFKFDIKVTLEKPEWALSMAGPVIVAGSTHKGEEDLIASSYIRLKEDFGDLNLIIAPRHPERSDEVEALLRAKGLPCVRRSRLKGREPLSGSVVILDTVGELSSAYGVADIAIVGGSFIGHGGQNPLEPAYWGKPVVCGPHMENFPFIQEFYEAGAAVRAEGPDLYGTLKDLLLSTGRREEIGRKAEELLKCNSGAVDKAVRVVEGYLKGHEAV